MEKQQQSLNQGQQPLKNINTENDSSEANTAKPSEESDGLPTQPQDEPQSKIEKTQQHFRDKAEKTKEKSIFLIDVFII